MSDKDIRFMKQDAADTSQLPQEPGQKKRSNRNMWIGVGVVAVLFALMVAVIMVIGDKSLADHSNKAWASGTPNVVVMHIDGAIEGDGDTYNQSWVNDTIRSAQNDKDNKAILLRIDSPGGTVYHSDETWRFLESYKKKTKRPVYAYCEQLCASGGYYIASAAGDIRANRNSLIGSIGVIGGTFIDADKLMDDLGVDVTVVHSGKNKLMGSIFEPPTEEQLAVMQSISDEAYEQFLGIVAQGRNKSPDEIRPLADGRIYTAKQATENGLIDGIETYTGYKKLIRKELKNDVEFVETSYEKPATWVDYLGVSTNSGSPFMAFFAKNDVERTVEYLESMQSGYPKYLYEG